MLANARCDNVIRRTALSIPAKYLIPVLLCSGLTRPLVTVIFQKLGHIIESAHEKQDTLAELMAPITTSASTKSHTGNKGKIFTDRKMLARIAAYVRLHEISFPTVNPFITCLLEAKQLSDRNEASNRTQQQKNSMTKISTTREMEAATSFLSDMMNSSE